MNTIPRNLAITTVGLVCVLFLGVRAPGADPQTDKEAMRDKVRLFMRAKLINSQNVLEGLTTENFDLVRQGAERMIVMSKAAEWRVGGSDTYSFDTAQFVSAAQDLIKQSKERNIDGATLSYVQLTMNCVSCHKHIRGEKTVGITIPKQAPSKRAAKRQAGGDEK
jgi:hypothetical protein